MNIGKAKARIGLFVLAALLTACSPRPVAERGDPYPQAKVHSIHVATQRALGHSGPSFGEARQRKIGYFSADISVPPTHKPGHIEWPKGPPDAATDFVVTRTERHGGGDAFARQVWSGTDSDEALLFVHGYNNTLSEALYRFAQIRADFKSLGPGVLFSWPSAGDPRGYAYDRDSVLYSRDDLEEVMQTLTARPGRKVFLLAHSMGAHLVMETLRQAALRGDRRLLNRVSGVVLMSPDIDPDLFRRQVEAIGDLPEPFVLFISRQDRVLSVASFISGRKARLGVIDSPEKVAGLGVQVVDFTALDEGLGLGHAVPVTSPAAIAVLNSMIEQAEGGDVPFEDYTVLEAEP